MKSTTVEIVNVSPGGRNVKYPLLNLSVQYSFQFGIKIKKKKRKEVSISSHTFQLIISFHNNIP